VKKQVLVLLVVALALLTGCWDDITHNYDCGDCPECPDGSSADTDTDADTDSDADGGDIDAGSNGQGDLPPGWEGFGAPCEVDEDCTGYPAAEKRCIKDLMGVVNAPGGYCTACCDWEGIDGCAQNIDCVGVNNTFVICASNCTSSDQCRTDEGWECRGLWYMESYFPDDYCMPDSDHVEPDTESPSPETQCPWPWL
jgi:hypothetical protein